MKVFYKHLIKVTLLFILSLTTTYPLLSQNNIFSAYAYIGANHQPSYISKGYADYYYTRSDGGVIFGSGLNYRNKMLLISIEYRKSKEFVLNLFGGGIEPSFNHRSIMVYGGLRHNYKFVIMEALVGAGYSHGYTKGSSNRNHGAELGIRSAIKIALSESVAIGLDFQYTLGTINNNLMLPLFSLEYGIIKPKKYRWQQ